MPKSNKDFVYHVFPDDSYFVSVWLSKTWYWMKPVIVLRHFGGDCISLLSLSLSLSESGVYGHRSACYKGTAVLLLLQQSSSNEVKLWEQRGFSLFIYLSVSCGRWVGDLPQEVLVKSGYRSFRFFFRIGVISWWSCYKNMAIWFNLKFSTKKLHMASL